MTISLIGALKGWQVYAPDEAAGGGGKQKPDAAGQPPPAQPEDSVDKPSSEFTGDIADILIPEFKSQIRALQEQLQAKQVVNQALNRIVAALREQLTIKNEEISSLRAQLESAQSHLERDANELQRAKKSATKDRKGINPEDPFTNFSPQDLDDLRQSFYNKIKKAIQDHPEIAPLAADSTVIYKSGEFDEHEKMLFQQLLKFHYWLTDKGSQTKKSSQ